MSIELDWELSEAPPDGPPQPAPEREHAPPPSAPLPQQRTASPAPRRRIRLFGPLLALVLLAGVGGLAAWQVTRLGWQRVQDDITALVQYEDAQAADGAVDLLLNVQDTSNADWVTARRAQARASLSAPLPLPLVKPNLGASSVDTITTLDADTVVATVRRTYLSAGGDQLEFVLPQVYRRDDTGDWQHTAPPGHFWGAWTDWQSDALHIRHSERDQPLVEAIAPRLEAWLRAACAAWGAQCGPAKLYLSGYVGSLEYSPLGNIEVRVEFGEDPAALPADYFLSIASPQLAGIPANAAAQDLMAEYLGVRLIALLAAEGTATTEDAVERAAFAIETLGLGRADPGYVALSIQQTEAVVAQVTADLQAAAEASRGEVSYPSRAIWRKYVIQPGDTLLGIASAFNVSVADLLRWNEIEDLDFIVAGATLVIPVATSLENLPSP